MTIKILRSPKNSNTFRSQILILDDGLFIFIAKGNDLDNINYYCLNTKIILSLFSGIFYPVMKIVKYE